MLPMELRMASPLGWVVPPKVMVCSVSRMTYDEDIFRLVSQVLKPRKSLTIVAAAGLSNMLATSSVVFCQKSLGTLHLEMFVLIMSWGILLEIFNSSFWCSKQLLNGARGACRCEKLTAAFIPFPFPSRWTPCIQNHYVLFLLFISFPMQNDSCKSESSSLPACPVCYGLQAACSIPDSRTNTQTRNGKSAWHVLKVNPLSTIQQQQPKKLTTHSAE